MPTTSLALSISALRVTQVEPRCLRRKVEPKTLQLHTFPNVRNSSLLQSSMLRPFSAKGVLSSRILLSSRALSDSSTSRPLDGRQSHRPALAHLPTPLLYEHARAEGAKGHFDGVLSIARVLLRDRGETPNRELYAALLHSFTSASNGTAGKARHVLAEMEGAVELDGRGCEVLLEVLAVHPDYLLRADVLAYMDKRWLPLTDRARSFVIAGLLRERHFEQALEMLDDMIRRSARVEPWLLDMAMWLLLEFGAVDEAFHVLGLKATLRDGLHAPGQAKVSSALWLALLDAAAQHKLHPAASLVWNAQVTPGHLKPTTGTCINVLALAAHHGDVPLATDVFRLLTERGLALAADHYELLLATYLQAQDLSAALSVLLIMTDANLKIVTATCQPLFMYLRGGPDRPLEAFGMLQTFETAGRKVPTAAINACMQASIALGNLEEAIEIYKALHTVSRAGPDTQTFNILFRGCHIAARKELAMFFANEMIQLGLKPDRITYDRLILVCLHADNIEDALLYYEEMRATRATVTGDLLMPRRGTWETLIHKCVDMGDERAVALLKDYQENTEEPRRGVAKVVEDRFEMPSSAIGLDPSGFAP